MAFKLLPNTAWVEHDGSYGIGTLVTFNHEDLTPAQWSVLAELSDYDKLPYVYAIMTGDSVDQWESK